MPKCKQRMVIISLDAVGSEDLEFLKTLPNFSKIWENAATCEQVQSVYPSITYPAHTSIITGKFPVNHRIINNIKLQPNRKNPDWYWHRKHIKGTTLYDEARKNGYRTAAILWPVTAGARIHYNLPEILANRPWQNQITVSALNGTTWYEALLYMKYGKKLQGIKQPYLDDFALNSATYTLGKFHPDLMMVHLTDVDTMRHCYGVHHEEVTKALVRQDNRLGELLEVLQKTGDMERTTLVVLGDHYQKDTNRVVYLNYLLKKAGLLTVQNDAVTDYDYIALNCDGSSYIYANEKKKVTEKKYLKLKKLLEAAKIKPQCGIKNIYTSKEAQNLGADDRCVFMIEAEDGVYFQDECQTLTLPIEEVQCGQMKGTHGYLPTGSDYNTFFLASGYKVENITIPSMRLVDEGPTLAKILSLHLPDCDGVCINEMTKI